MRSVPGYRDKSNGGPTKPSRSAWLRGRQPARAIAPAASSGFAGAGLRARDARSGDPRRDECSDLRRPSHPSWRPHGKVEQIKTRLPLDDALRPIVTRLEASCLFGGRVRAVIVQNLDMARREGGRPGVRGRIWVQMRRALLPNVDQLARQRMMYSHVVVLLTVGCAQWP